MSACFMTNPPRLPDEDDGSIRLDAILLCSFPSQIQQEVFCMLQYSILLRLVEESHDVGIVVPGNDSRCAYGLW